MKKTIAALISVLLFAVALSSCPKRAVKVFKDEGGAPVVFKRFPVEWTFDCEFPEEDKFVVREGFRYWNARAGRDLFKESDTCGVASLDAPLGEGVLAIYNDEFRSNGRSTFATAYSRKKAGVPIGGVINYYVTWKVAEPNVQISVSRHEIGHLLGFDHSDERNCLMFYAIDYELYETSPKEMCKEEEQAFSALYRKAE